MKTRSKPTSSAAKQEAPSESRPTKKLPPSHTNPPKVVVLPKDSSSESRIVTLQNPATSRQTRYFYCPNLGLYEFTKVSASKKNPRSWLIVGDGDDAEKPSTESSAEPTGDVIGCGYMVKEPDMMLATPFDVLFIVLPVLLPASATSGAKQMFLALDDYLDALGKTSPHMKQLLASTNIRQKIEDRMSVVCDTVDAGDEKMYRASHEKLILELLAKARRMSANGLPPSMEEHFIADALKAPVFHVADPGTSEQVNADSSQAKDEETLIKAECESPLDSQSGIHTNADFQPSISTAATSFSTDSANIASRLEASKAEADELRDQVKQLLRLRTSLSFLLSSYVPAHLRTIIQAAIPTRAGVDFAPLDAHLEHLASLRRQAHALRSVSDNISRKRAAVDDEAAEARAEKKRKKEDDEKRKKAASRALKELEKVDTSGMKKLSSFFTKKSAAT